MILDSYLYDELTEYPETEDLRLIEACRVPEYYLPFDEQMETIKGYLISLEDDEGLFLKLEVKEYHSHDQYTVHVHFMPPETDLAARKARMEELDQQIKGLMEERCRLPKGGFQLASGTILVEGAEKWLPMPDEVTPEWLAAQVEG